MNHYHKETLALSREGTEAFVHMEMTEMSVSHGLQPTVIYKTIKNADYIVSFMYTGILTVLHIL